MNSHDERRLSVSAAFAKDPRSAFTRVHELIGWAEVFCKMEKTWTEAATIVWLNKHPLPEIRWYTLPVRPVHRPLLGYGTWLFNTPYFPGLFEACRSILADWRGRETGDGAELVARLISMKFERTAAR
jgi:hypothetical protein